MRLNLKEILPPWRILSIEQQGVFILAKKHSSLLLRGQFFSGLLAVSSTLVCLRLGCTCTLGFLWLAFTCEKGKYLMCLYFYSIYVAKYC